MRSTASARSPLPGRRSLLAGRLHDGSATGGRAAFTDVKLLQLGVVLPGSLVLVVVDELGSRLYPVERVDEDLPAGNHRLAIGLAGVIDEAGVASARAPGTIDRHVFRQREEKGVVTLHRIVVIAAVGLIVVDVLANVFDDPRALPDVAIREHTTPMDV